MKPTNQSIIADFPSVRIDAALKQSPAMSALQELLLQAALELHKHGAWDPVLGPIEIFIYKSGVGLGKDLGPGIWTDPNQDDDNMEGPPQRKNDQNIRILVEQSLFENGIGARMEAREASKYDIALWCLGHEIFHLNEVDRKAAVGILSTQGETGFAGAVQPSFPTPWKIALQEFTKKYPNNARLSPIMREAGDIANEASADMTAMYYLKLSGRDWLAFAKKLADLRQSDVKKWESPIAVLVRLLPWPISKPRPYRISDAINAFIFPQPDDLLSLQSVYAKCWNLAKEKIMAAGDFDGEVRKFFVPLPELVLSASIPASPTSPIAPPYRGII